MQSTDHFIDAGIYERGLERTWINYAGALIGHGLKELMADTHVKKISLNGWWSTLEKGHFKHGDQLFPSAISNPVLPKPHSLSLSWQKNTIISWPAVSKLYLFVPSIFSSGSAAMR